MFGHRLKELREAKGLTQKGLADATGLSQRAISHWEQGLRQPSWDNVVSLCDALGVTCEEFRRPSQGGTPAPTPRGRPRKDSGDADAASAPGPTEKPKRGGKKAGGKGVGE